MSSELGRSMLEQCVAGHEACGARHSGTVVDPLGLGGVPAPTNHPPPFMLQRARTRR